MILKHPEEGVQWAVSVPKSRFSKAVDRNRIKRQMREAWRVRRENFSQRILKDHPGIAIMMVYSDRKKLPSDRINDAMDVALKRLLKKLDKQNSNDQ
jgi:ribonuclease P protein component